MRLCWNLIWHRQMVAGVGDDEFLLPDGAHRNHLKSVTMDHFDHTIRIEGAKMIGAGRTVDPNSEQLPRRLFGTPQTRNRFTGRIDKAAVVTAQQTELRVGGNGLQESAVARTNGLDIHADWLSVGKRDRALVAMGNADLRQPFHASSLRYPGLAARVAADRERGRVEHLLRPCFLRQPNPRCVFGGNAAKQPLLLTLGKRSLFSEGAYLVQIEIKAGEKRDVESGDVGRQDHAADCR